MVSVRRQLSMYAPPPIAAAIDAVRRVVDPTQHGLIPAHLTLCREHELPDLRGVQRRLRRLPLARLELTFGVAVPFSGHGLLLPSVAGEPMADT